MGVRGPGASTPSLPGQVAPFFGGRPAIPGCTTRRLGREGTRTELESPDCEVTALLILVKKHYAMNNLARRIGREWTSWEITRIFKNPPFSKWRRKNVN